MPLIMLIVSLMTMMGVLLGIAIFSEAERRRYHALVKVEYVVFGRSVS
jgi:hypothetical protein